MTTEAVIAPAPAGLGDAGTALWDSLHADLAPGYSFDHREEHLLAEACRIADHLADLEAVLAREGMMAAGSAGQPVAHPALAEARQQRLVLLRLIGQLDFGTEAGADSLSSRHARKAAQTRWTRKANIERRRAEAAEKG